MKKYCMGVVVYNPSLEELHKIEEYAQSGLFGHIMVFDNSPLQSSYVFKNIRCHYRFQNENTGLARPYNIMLHEADALGYNYLCLMDQDSSFKAEEIKRLIEAIDRYDGSDTVGIFCPVVLKNSTDAYKRSREWHTIDWTINSGSILNVKCLKNHSLFYDENIFLDGLDYDFCWTVKNKGCMIKQYQDSILVQNFGYKRHASQSFTYHSAYRYYLIAHNRKYIFKKHYGVIKGIIYAQLKNLNLSLRILINEENKIEKMRSCFKGIFK